MKNLKFPVFLTLLFILLSGCASQKIARNMEPRQPLPEAMVALVGRIHMEPEPIQDIGGLMPASVKEDYIRNSYAMMSIQDKEKLESIFDADVAIQCPWDDYFIVMLPRKDINWVTLMTAIATGSQNITMYQHSPLKISFEPDDQVVYIGELHYRFNVENDLGGKDTILEIKDGFGKALQRFEGYILDNNGNPAEIKNRTIQGEIELTTEVIEMVVTHRPY